MTAHPDLRQAWTTLVTVLDGIAAVSRGEARGNATWMSQRLADYARSVDRDDQAGRDWRSLPSKFEADHEAIDRAHHGAEQCHRALASGGES